MSAPCRKELNWKKQNRKKKTMRYNTQEEDKTEGG
jgi:hypothetical protein